MKAILIDVKNKELKEVDIDGLDSIYKAMGIKTIELATHIDKKNLIYVDEEGMFGDTGYWFRYRGSRAFAGNGLITGIGRDGQSKSTTISLEDAKSNVTFLSRSEI